MSTRTGYYKKQIQDLGLIRSKQVNDDTAKFLHEESIFEVFLRNGNLEFLPSKIYNNPKNKGKLSKPVILSILKRLVSRRKLVKQRDMSNPHSYYYGLNPHWQPTQEYLELRKLWYSWGYEFFDGDLANFYYLFSNIVKIRDIGEGFLR